MNHAKPITLLFFLCLIPFTTLLAQTGGQGEETARHPERSVLFGLGRVSQLETYLSPQAYKGPQFSLLHTTLRPTRFSHGRIAFRSAFYGNASTADTPAERADYLGGDLHYDATWLHHLPALFPGLRWMAGAGAGLTLGGLYTTRSGNNPAQLHLQGRLSASLLADYTFHIKKKVLRARYEADLPLLGAMFSPAYGQSYYEIFSLGHYDHNAVLTHPGNALSLRQLLTFDLSVRRGFFRIGYLSDIRQAKPNRLKQHHISRSLMIGFVKQIK